MFSCYWSMKTKILWSFLIQTDHEVINNKFYVTAVDKINKAVNLIDVAVQKDLQN